MAEGEQPLLIFFRATAKGLPRRISQRMKPSPAWSAIGIGTTHENQQCNVAPQARWACEGRGWQPSAAGSPGARVRLRISTVRPELGENWSRTKALVGRDSTGSECCQPRSRGERFRHAERRSGLLLWCFCTAYPFTWEALASSEKLAQASAKTEEKSHTK